MDPLSALSVATAVVNFLEFAGALISTANEIRHSIDGASLDNLKLEDITQKLHSCSNRLMSPHRPDNPGSALLNLRPVRASEDVIALRDLSLSCQDDCNEILEILKKVKVQGQNQRLWRSIKAALKHQSEQSKISGIKERLERTQMAMSLHVGAIMRGQLSHLTDNLQAMRRDNERSHMSQESKLDFIREGLCDLKLELDKENRKPSSFERAQVLLAPQLVWHEKRLVDLLTTEHDIMQEQAILVSLDFQSRPVRYESIQEACASTFKWTFNSNFARWANSEDGVFWVAGKAGSGKSTFMKYITDHDSIRDMLSSWAYPKMVVIATHYFWAAGTSIQKSHKGLLQSILYDIFRQCPACIPVACPARWSRNSQQTSTWSMTELSTCLNILAKEADLPTKFCFFIDGLDEFGNDHLELCEIIRDLSRSPHIKLCVSSRPLNVFTKNFGENPSKRIYVHDLTENDIITFARLQLEKHPCWETCGALPKDRDSLVRDIGHRAEGVFLWAFLVTRSLRDGLTNEDTMHELRKRLDSLPNDLERLFMHMLSNVDSIYHEKMAGMLQIAVHAKEPLILDIYGFHEKEYEDPHYAVHCEVKERDPEQTSLIRSQTSYRINARSSGLLEVRDYTVQFLHRTVSDFLRTREMSDYLELKSKPGFDPYCSVVKAFVAVIKSSRFRDGVARQRPPRRASGDLIILLQGILDYASEAEKCSGAEVVDLLDELEYALIDMFKTQQAYFILGECHPKLLFREEIFRSNVAGYIAKKLSEIPEYLVDFEVSPLSVALETELPYVDTIRALLQTGEDPNEQSMLSDTEYVEPWVRFVYDASPWSVTPLGRQPFNVLLDRGFFSLFLGYGADPNSKMPGYDFTVFAMYLMTVFPTISRRKASICAR